jgi:2'-5' RNA ligase
MQCDPPTTDRINSFSLVSYIPGRLGEFLTGLRQELVASCVAQSHVTVLPPRPLFIGAEAAAEELRERVAAFAPVRIGIPRIRVFEQTAVIYVDVGEGRDDLIYMHQVLNSGPFFFEEPFNYHPHVTLAQGMTPEELPALYETTVRRWKEAGLNTWFVVDTLTFVQNTVENRWIDLAECALRGEAAVSLR